MTDISPTVGIVPTPPLRHAGIRGHLAEFSRDRLSFLEKNRAYGDIAILRFGPVRAFQLNHPELVHEVLVKQAHYFHKSRALRHATDRLMGNGLLLSEDSFHRHQRRLIQPAFHHSRLTAYSEVMARFAASARSAWQPGAVYDMHREMMHLTLRIIGQVLFDVDFAGSAAELGRAISIGVSAASDQIGRPLVRPPRWLPTHLNRQRNAASASLIQAIDKVIHEHRQAGGDRGDLLSMLLLSTDEESGEGMDDQQVRAEAMTLFLAGHETTANALAWTLFLIATHPEIENELLKEIDTVLNRHLPTADRLPLLVYTQMVIKEALRLYPPAWVISRRAAQNVEVGGVLLPKRAPVIMSPWSVQRDPRWWPDPLRFDPARFSPSREHEIARFAFFPFGGGPRICIGNSFAMMEAQIILVTILQHYRVSLLPGETVAPEPLITLRPRGGIRMKVELRQPVAASANAA